MPFSRPEVNIRAPPTGFDDLVEWLEAWSYNLVLLEEYPLPDVQEAVRSVSAAVRSHGVSTDRWLTSVRPEDEEVLRGVRLLVSDHAWFATSVEQFAWFLHIVEREDHGGHRQALGQYGRILAEALRRHRRDERWLEGRTSTPPAAGTPRRSGKP